MFRLMKLSKKLRMQMFVMAALSVVFAALSLAAPFLLGNVIDEAAAGLTGGTAAYDKALLGLIILTVIYALTALFSWLVSAWSARISQDTAEAVRTAVFKKYNRLPLREIDSRSQGDLLARAVADTEILAEGVLQGASRLIADLILILGTLGFLIYINGYLALVVIGLTPFSALAATLIARSCQKHFNRQATVGGEMSGHLSEYLSGIKTVKALGISEKSEENFEKLNEEFGSIGVRATFASTLVNPSARLVNNIIFACVAAVGGVMCIGGLLSAGLLSAALAYVYQYGKPFNELSGISTELQKAASAAKRINEILDLPEEEDGADLEITDYQRFSGAVEFDSVDFSYDGVPFMTDLNLKVAAGQKVAVVGPTGGGKTTLINLLMRFYDVTGGAIKIDGVDIRKMPRKILRQNIGMVLQESWLFEGTVEKNISYGKEGAGRTDAEAAAKKAHAHEFIQKLQKNYDTVLSEHSALSEGQRQQIALARVMLADAPILIFDEATSNLDAKTEQNIVDAIAEISSWRTTFVVAHRLTTVKSADLVIVINGGKIIERGTHSELLAANGFYKELYEKQLNSEA